MDLYKYTKKVIKYKNRKIQTYEYGEGKNIILALPSFPSSGLFYIPFFSQARLDHYRIITLDLPGWSGKTLPLNKKYNPLEDYAQIVIGVAESYNLKNFTLMGYSYGGALAVRTANLIKPHIKNIILLSPVIDKNYLDQSLEIVVVKIANRFRLNTLFKKVVIWKFKELLKKSPAEYIAYRKLVYKLLNNMSGEVILNDINTLFTQVDLTEDLKRISDIRVLIVNSKQEKKFYRKQAMHIRKVLHSETTFFSKGMHEDLLITRNEALMQEILEFAVKR